MQLNSNVPPSVSRLCGLGVFLFVVGGIAYGGVMIGEARMNAAATWPSVSGQITRSELSTATVKTGPVRRAQPIAEIHFTYTVKGRSYKGDGLRVVPMLHTRPEGTPTELVSRYPVGTSVAVYYDPNNPSDSLLLPRAAADARELTRSLGFIGISVALVGVLLIGVGGVNFYRSRTSMPAPAPDETQASVPVPAATPPAKRRTTHWVILTAAVLLGLVFILVGGVFFLASLAVSTPTASTSVVVVARIIFAVVALLGVGLVYFGIKK